MSELLRGLVEIPSPTGQEVEAVAWLQAQARADGFVVHDDRAGNFIAERPGPGMEAPCLWFVGHIDTVAGHIPVRIEDGPDGPTLWGRGSVDAKGCLAAAYEAVRDLSADLPLRIFVVGCVDEEGASAGARALDLPDPDWIVIGEPSGSDGFTLAYKGILRATTTFTRPHVHGGHPAENALDAMHTWWAATRDEVDAGTGFDSVQCRLDDLHVDDDGLQQSVRIDWQMRIPPGIDPAELVAHLPDADTLVREAIPAAQADRRSPLAVWFRGAIRAEGMTPRPLRKTGTADFNLLAARYPDVPILAYGPGDSALDHAPDERLPLAEYGRAVAVWQRVLDQASAASEASAASAARGATMTRA